MSALLALLCVHDTHCLSQGSYAVMKPHRQSNVGRTGFVWHVLPHHGVTQTPGLGITVEEGLGRLRVGGNGRMQVNGVFRTRQSSRTKSTQPL